MSAVGDAVRALADAVAELPPAEAARFADPLHELLGLTIARAMEAEDLEELGALTSALEATNARVFAGLLRGTAPLH